MTAAQFTPGIALCQQEPRTEQGAPWPIAWECHSDLEPDHSCPQSDGSHVHAWVAWPDAPAQVTAGPGTPVRCKTCGGRKCDIPTCLLRRHHGGDHEHF
jgi:hypothetical protein